MSTLLRVATLVCHLRASATPSATPCALKATRIRPKHFYHDHHCLSMLCSASPCRYCTIFLISLFPPAGVLGRYCEC